MIINNEELIEIEQKLLKTISGNGLAINRFMKWIKLKNTFKEQMKPNICPRCLHEMEILKNELHDYYCKNCNLCF